MTKGTGTRSGLLWEVERLLTECEELSRNINRRYGMPQILLMENVPQVHSKANLEDFEQWCAFLKKMGYDSFYQDLNARDYGVAQNRNRCFMVSALGNYTYQFPNKIPLEKVMKDYLEEEVEDKYYITSEKAQKLIDTLILEGKIPTNERTNERTGLLTCATNTQDSLKCLTQSRQDMTPVSETTNLTTQASVKSIGYLNKGTGEHQSNKVYDSNGLLPTEYAVQHKEPFKIVDCKKWY